MDSQLPTVEKREFLKATAGGAAIFNTVGFPAGLAAANEHSPDAPNIVAQNFQGVASAVVGQRVSASATLYNSGGAAGEVDVEYRIAGEFVAARSNVRLDAGASQNIVLSGTVPNVPSGARSHGIYLDGAPVTGSGIVINPSSGDVRVNSVTQFASQGQVGDTVSITAQVENRGGATDTSRFEFRIGGQLVARTSERTLGPGETLTFSLSGQVPILAAGTYTQGVFVGSSSRGTTTSFTVTSGTASFEIETFQAPSRAQGGSTVTARARVRNTGGSRGRATFQYRIDDTQVATAEAALDPGQAETLTLQGTVPDRSSGIYQQRVSERETGRGRTLNIRIDEDPAAKFAISRLRAPAKTEAGSNITVGAEVRNTGRERDQTRIEYRINGNRLAREEVDIRPGETVRLTFEATVPDLRRGTYVQGVFVDRTARGQTTSLTVAERARVDVDGLIATRSATVGDRVLAYATLRNRSDSQITRRPEYRIGNRVVQRREIELGPGEVLGVQFEGTAPEVAPGSYAQGVYLDDRSSTSTIAIRARPAPRAAFDISEFDGDGSGVVGEPVSAQATVRNTGDASGTTSVEYRINDRVVASREITLDAGAEQTVSFEGTVPDVPPGDYRHGVFVADTTEGQERGFTVQAGEPRFVVSNVRAPPNGAAGDSITVEATITNTGNAAGETRIQYRFDGESLETETVELPRGDEQDVAFDAEVPDVDAGTYSHGVFVGDTNEGQTTSFVVDAGPTASPTEDDGTGFGALSGVAGVLGGTAYVLKRRLGSDADAPGE